MTVVAERDLPFLDSQERTKNPTTLNAEGERHSIFDYYSAENELAFVTKKINPELPTAEQLSSEQLIFYLQENISKFLGEFAGKIPYTYITYTLENGSVKYAGIDILNMLESTNQLTGHGSREWYENEGLRKAYNAHLGNGQPPAHLSAIISPPKDWDYNFTFLNERKYDPRLGIDTLKMHAVRRTEHRGTVTESQRILRELESDTTRHALYSKAEDFLANPIIDSATIRTVDQGLRAIGLTEEEILYSRLFERKVMGELSNLIEEYTHNMLRLAVEDQKGVLSKESKQERIKGLNQIISTAFVIAEDIRDSLQETLKNGNIQRLQDNQPRFSTNEEMFMYASEREVWVVDGGSCPVAGAGSTFMSTDDISNGFRNGVSFGKMIDSQYERNRNKDPHRKVTGTRVTNCPECGKSGVIITAEDINAGILRCDNVAGKCKRNTDPFRATNAKDQLGFLCIWDTSAEPITRQHH